MNTLKKICGDDSEKYTELLFKIISNLTSSSITLERLYNENELEELKVVSHNIRNMAGLLGKTKLKIMATYWEDLCRQRKGGDIMEFKLAIDEVLSDIEKRKQ